MLQQEIIRRGLYINNITDLIKNILKHCDKCIIHKLNKYIKPKNVQILSNHPIERVQADLTYFNKRIELYELKEKYLINSVDYFSKFTKSYLIENKSVELVLEKIKDFIKTVGKPSILHIEYGGEFTANITKLFCNTQKIKLVNGAA